MSDDKTLPLSGYAISGVHTISQVLQPKEATDSAEGGVRFGWDWRQVEQDVFEVLIRLAVEPAAARPYSASVELVGRFRQTVPSPSVPREEFASLQAVAILLPYARQFLATLTLSTASGAYHLPSVNVAALMQGFDVKATTGAGQGDTQIGTSTKGAGHAAKIASRRRRAGAKSLSRS